MKCTNKFVSVDGLMRFEESVSDGRPDRYIRRMAAYPLRREDYKRSGCDLPPAVVRQYELYDCYLDPQTGRYTFEYREQP